MPGLVGGTSKTHASTDGVGFSLQWSVCPLPTGYWLLATDY